LRSLRLLYVSWRYAPVEQPDRLALHIRCEVRVAERHLDALVAEQLLDRLERGAAHDEVAREGVAEAVRRDALPEPCAAAGVRDDVLDHRVRQALA